MPRPSIEEGPAVMLAIRCMLKGIVKSKEYLPHATLQEHVKCFWRDLRFAAYNDL